MGGYEVSAEQYSDGGDDGEHGFGSIGSCSIYSPNYFSNVGKVVHGE
jgi:hypothetical protein